MKTKRNTARVPKQRRGQERFETILDCAAKLMKTVPPTKLNHYQIAKEIGCAPATVYHLFPSMNALFCVLLQRYRRSLLTYLKAEDSIVSHDNWHALLHHKFERTLTYFVKTPELQELLFNQELPKIVSAPESSDDETMSGYLASIMRGDFQTRNVTDLDLHVTRTVQIFHAVQEQRFVDNHGPAEIVVNDATEAALAYLEAIVPKAEASATP